jgi:hypothetical protein
MYWGVMAISSLSSAAIVYQRYAPTVPAVHRLAHALNWPSLGWVFVHYKDIRNVDTVGYHCDQCDTIVGHTFAKPGTMSVRLSLKDAENVLSRRIFHQTPWWADRYDQHERLSQLRLSNSPHRIQLEHMLKQEGYQGWSAAGNPNEDSNAVGDAHLSVSRWML